MSRKIKGKRNIQIASCVDTQKQYSVEDSIEALKSCPAIKFVETVDIAINLDIDPTKPNQHVRGSMSLPHGRGKSVVVAVLAAGENAEIARKAGADIVGDSDLEKNISDGFMKFDVLITTPDMMRNLSKLARKLGPKGLMPSPKAGTVTTNVAETIKEFKLGRLELKSNRNASIHAGVGKLDMTNEQLADNVHAVIKNIVKMKPTTVSGKYVKSIYITSTMGPGLKIDADKYVN